MIILCLLKNPKIPLIKKIIYLYQLIRDIGV
jgi:hypothetical protein